MATVKLAVVRSAHRVICCSRYIAADVCQRLGGQRELEDKIRVVHNGADMERFRPDPAKRAGGVPIVLFVGRVIPEKGPDLLLKAAAKVHATGRRFVVRIVGSSGFSAADPLTAYETELRRLAAPLEDAVVFQPFVDRTRVIDEYQAASIFCAIDLERAGVAYRSRSAGQRIGGHRVKKGRDTEVGGEAVLYFDPPDVEMLARHLEMLLDDAVAGSGAIGRGGRRGSCRGNGNMKFWPKPSAWPWPEGIS